MQDFIIGVLVALIIFIGLLINYDLLDTRMFYPAIFLMWLFISIIGLIYIDRRMNNE